METIFIYLLKSSALITLFYLVYHLLLRTETFFNTNRWFLQLGLVVAVVLPFFSIKKIVYVKQPKIDATQWVQMTSEPIVNATPTEATTLVINWFEVAFWLYGIVALFLLTKVLYTSFSLYKLLQKRSIQKENNFLFVDIEENVAPFSFFNFIVFNSKLYTESELQSILSHEKIHSQQKHSIDVLIAKLLSIVFWFNPFVHWYKNAIAQNLEYIADQKAIEGVADKKSYQLTLLKVVSHQNCLPITNHFYQPRLPGGRSLIKKRIVMLNTNQSEKRNAWKYIVVLPILIAFVLLFQVKTIAQERHITKISKNNDSGVYITTHKNSTDAEMKRDAEMVKEKYGVSLKYSKIKRNSKGEITGIKVTYKDQDGNTGTTQLNGTDPIKPIHFYKTDTKIGFGKGVKTIAIAANGGNKVVQINKDTGDDNADESEMKFDFDFDSDENDDVITWDGNTASESKIVIKKNGKKPVVIVNGKVIEGNEAIKLEELEKLGAIGEGYAYHYDDDVNVFTNIDIDKIANDAFENVRIHLKELTPEIKAQIIKEMDEAKRQMKASRSKMKAEIARVQSEIEPELEKAKAEMEQARAEMMQARADMEKAKAELEKAKSEMKNK